MARLIDADALMGQLEKKRSGPGNQRYTEGFNDSLMRFRSMIHSARTIDAEPVRHGRWEEYPNSAYRRCTSCKKEFEKAKFSIVAPRCPICGAMMDGGGSNEG